MKHWLRYFETNARREDRVPWDSDGPLTAAERRAVSNSMAIFQLGESSEGKNLMRFAKEWAETHDEPWLVPITRYFIREEQRHAALLGRFMRAQNIPFVGANWTDRVFRHLRKRAGYELSVSVLVVAEIIALVYYPALREATSSPVLRAICEQILDEEHAHVRYQMERIRDVRSRHSSIRLAATVTAHRILYAVTLIVVFASHHRVFRRARVGPATYWRLGLAAMARASEVATDGDGSEPKGLRHAYDAYNE